MPISTHPPTGLAAVLEAKRQQLAQLQEEIATLERAHAILSQGTTERRPSPNPPRRQQTRRGRRGLTIGAVVLEAMSQAKTPWSMADMYQACQARGLRISRGSLKDWIGKAHRRGLIHRVKLGQYTVAPGSPQPASADSKAAPQRTSTPAARRTPSARSTAKRPRPTTKS